MTIRETGGAAATGDAPRSRFLWRRVSFEWERRRHPELTAAEARLAVFTGATLSWMIRDPLTGEEFLRVVGKRVPPPLDEPPSAGAREKLAAMARYRTRAPKGIFIYRSHAEMDADRLRWTVEAMVERARNG